MAAQLAAQITASLPAIDFSATGPFLRQVGFETEFMHSGGMMRSRGLLEIEFFA
ncbi:MAG: hypothetical protein ACO33A_14480 [Hyphomonas sp.]